MALVRSFYRMGVRGIQLTHNERNYLADGIGILVSDKRPVSPDEGDTTYRLSAWVNVLPPDPAVEFEIPIIAVRR